ERLLTGRTLHLHISRDFLWTLACSRAEQKSRSSVPGRTLLHCRLQSHDVRGAGTHPFNAARERFKVHWHLSRVRPIVYRCPDMDLPVISGILCEEGTCSAMSRTGIAIECPVCASTHIVKIRLPRGRDDLALTRPEVSR